MNLYLTLFIIAIHNVYPRTTDVTLGLHDRVKLLKKQIVQEIQQNQNRYVTPIIDDFTEHEYVDLDSQPITPISNDDERKKKNKYNLRQLKTTTEVDNHKALKTHKKRVRKIKRKGRKRKAKPQATDIFYRRQYDTELLESSYEWTHCQDLITPFLNGMKTNFSDTKKVTVKDAVVLRLVQLLKVNTTGQSKEDIYSIMYQISNLQLRLFQWDFAAIQFLFKNLIKQKSHSFAALKHALKEVFSNWSLDITNTTNLLKQARIFRPPCVEITGHGGSTKPPKGLRYTKTEKKRCTYDEDDGECRDP